MGVGQEYEVLVFKRVRTDQNMPGHVLTLVDRPHFPPGRTTLLARARKLDHHRRNTYTN